MTPSYFIGIDVGTQGARVALVDSSGNRLGTGEQEFPLTPGSQEEQSPDLWWDACLKALQDVVAEVQAKIDLSAVKAIAVTSTSGTVIPLDSANRPLHPAIMYSDKRSAAEGAICKKAAIQSGEADFIGFNSSCGLAKMVWFVHAFQEKAARLARWAHAADYLTGMLSNRWGITDHSNALKSGYVISAERWPNYIEEDLHIKKEWLPNVVPSGTPIGNLCTRVAQQTGLPATVTIVSGITDGCASQLASGAVRLGDWNTTIGTTLVVKGVTKEPIADPEGRLYNHRHPDGWWMPGGASNIGADWITKEFKADLAALNASAALLIPTGKIAYPLRQQGERFPFIAPTAEGFDPAGSLSREQLFTAYLEGVAFVERYAFEMIEALSGERVEAVYTAGGGSNSEVWLTIRSNVLQRPLYKMREVSGSMGAAILAASQTHFGSLQDAAIAMTQVETKVEPQRELSRKYNEQYSRFLTALIQKGYIPQPVTEGVK
jgi:D-ribulokinase